MSTRLDDAILARVERASHWTQVRLDLDCYDLARACHLLTFGVAAGVTSAQRLGQETLMVMGCLASFATMLSIIMWRGYAVLKAYYAEGPDVAHPYTVTWREGHQAHRLLILCFGIPGAAGYGLMHQDAPEGAAVWLALALLAWLGAMYLQCCIPLPPGAVRQRRAERERRTAAAAAIAAGTESPV